MLTLSLESTTETIDLNELLTTPEGMQALAGITGLGLPPVSVQWSENVGDGAKYRGSRLLSRPIDLPLWIQANDRAGLKTQIQKLSRILSAPATLRLISDDTEYTATVVRSGGGDITYGVDTDGETSVQMIVTLTAGDPYWTATTPSTSLPQTVSTSAKQLSIYNEGTAPAAPVLIAKGPMSNLKMTLAGKTVQYTGSIPSGQTLVIDCGAGSVKLDGASAYRNLAPGPRFFKLAAGDNSMTVSASTAGAGSSLEVQWSSREWMVV